MPQDLGMVSCDEAAGEHLGDSPGSQSLDFVISKIEIRGPTPPCVVVERINETIEKAQRTALRWGHTIERGHTHREALSWFLLSLILPVYS